jgi:GNAT superfamily N-acetyltransferase
MLTVRRATEDDHLDLFKLLVPMHRETDFQHYVLNPEKSFASLGNWIHNKNNLCFVAINEVKIVGAMFGTVAPLWFSDELVAREDLLYVHPDYRGGRAAYILAKAFLEAAKSAGIKHVQAGVSTGLGQGAERLYRHLGMTYMGGNFVAHF